MKKAKKKSGKKTKSTGAKESSSRLRQGAKQNSVRTEIYGAGQNSKGRSAKNSDRAESTGGHFSKRAPEPVGPYPHARRVGDFIFVSGMGPRRPGTSDIPGVTMDAMSRVQSYDIEVQTHAVIQNIKMVLEDMGSGLEDIVDVSVFLTNIKNDFKTFNKVYGEYFAKIGPTRTTVEVRALPTPINVELKVIAYKP